MLSTGILVAGASREAQSQAPPSLPLPSGLQRPFSDGRDLSLNGAVLLTSWLSLLTLRKPFSIKPKIYLSLSLPQATSCLHLGPMLGSPEARVLWLSFCLLFLFLRDCCLLFLLLYFTFACNSSLIFLQWEGAQMVVLCLSASGTCESGSLRPAAGPSVVLVWTGKKRRGRPFWIIISWVLIN